MKINEGIDLALQLKASRAFKKLANMQDKRYAQAAEIFGQPIAVNSLAIAEIENVFGNV
jgi:hypothetical protein